MSGWKSLIVEIGDPSNAWDSAAAVDQHHHPAPSPGTIVASVSPPRIEPECHTVLRLESTN